MKKNSQRAAYWRDILKRQAGSGLSVRRFCATNEISEPSFYQWRKKLAQRDQEGLATSSGASRRRADNTADGRGFMRR